MTPRACAYCGGPATCLGAYEDMTERELACDTCCGHGGEDGHCDRICADCGAEGDVDLYDDDVFRCEACGSWIEGDDGVRAVPVSPIGDLPARDVDRRQDGGR